MALQEDVVEVPYCSICRRSSDLKWRKHVFSKSHQHAASNFLAVRVAHFDATRAKVTAPTPSPRQNTDESKLFCVFCEANIAHDGIVGYGSESLRLWIQHAASTSHRKRVTDFCKHHRCDAVQQVRQQLCITADDTDMLIRALDDQERARVATAANTQPNLLAPSATNAARDFTKTVHIEAFLNSVATRLQQAAHKLPSAAPSDSTMQRHQSLPPMHSAMGTTASNNKNTSFSHRTTDVAYGAGLGSISRVGWGEQIANVHSSAVPPWMVDTEEEYKRCNSRPPSSSQRHGTKRKQERTGTTTGGGDIFARMAPQYDEKTWLPNFGGVWQEGPRSKTRHEFNKTRPERPSSLTTRVDHPLPPAAAAPVRKTTTPPMAETVMPTQIKPTSDHARAQRVVDGSHPSASETTSSSLATIAATSHQAETSSTSVVVPSELDAKKALLLAQKERLRAKLAAKRRAPTPS